MKIKLYCLPEGYPFTFNYTVTDKPENREFLKLLPQRTDIQCTVISRADMREMVLIMATYDDNEIVRERMLQQEDKIPSFWVNKKIRLHAETLVEI